MSGTQIHANRLLSSVTKPLPDDVLFVVSAPKGVSPSYTEEYVQTMPACCELCSSNPHPNAWAKPLEKKGK